MTRPVIHSRRGNQFPSCYFFPRLLGLFAALLISAQAAERVIFHPGWFTSAQFAGIFTALDQGFYRDAGLEVEIEPFAYGQNSPATIDATPETCALGTIEGYILLQKRNEGANLKALAAMLQESPAGYITLTSSKIESVRDFSGHRVGVHKFADTLFRWFIHQSGLAPGEAPMVFVGDDITMLTRGEVDVMQGYATEEFIRLQELTGSGGRFLSFRDLGFPSYSEILYTTSGQVERHAATLRKFLAATRRGWKHVLADPEEAAGVLAKHLGPVTDRPHLQKTLDALVSYVCPNDQEPLAAMDPVRWRIVQRVAFETGLIREIEPVESFLLNW